MVPFKRPMAGCPSVGGAHFSFAGPRHQVGRAAVAHYVHHEWARHLADVMRRRSGWHYYERESAAQLEQVATWMAELLGWSDAERAAELAACRTDLPVPPTPPVPSVPPAVVSPNRGQNFCRFHR